MNKKITAIIAAAILALNISIPVFAEQESEIPSDTSVLSAAESAESDDISDNEDTQTDSSADEAESEVSENSAEKPKVYYTDYAIPEAEMYISFPKEMYVLTRDIDMDSPVLKASGMTKT